MGCPGTDGHVVLLRRSDHRECINVAAAVVCGESLRAAGRIRLAAMLPAQIQRAPGRSERVKATNSLANSATGTGLPRVEPRSEFGLLPLYNNLRLFLSSHSQDPFLFPVTSPQ